MTTAKAKKTAEPQLNNAAVTAAPRAPRLAQKFYAIVYAKPAPNPLLDNVESSGEELGDEIETIEASTKREMRDKLGDPRISEIVTLFRGRRLDFETKKVVSFT